MAVGLTYHPDGGEVEVVDCVGCAAAEAEAVSFFQVLGFYGSYALEFGC